MESFRESFKESLSTEDRFSRGLLHAVLVLVSMLFSGIAFRHAVDPFGWLTGTVEPPAEVLVPARRDYLVEYSSAAAWMLLLGALFFGVFFAVGTVLVARLTVEIFQRAGAKTRLARQRKRHARRNPGTQGRPGGWPEPKNDAPDGAPGPGPGV